jgi:hypothetical protein
VRFHRRAARDGQRQGGNAGRPVLPLGWRLLPHLPGHGHPHYLEDNGTLKKAQQIAAHSSPRTTKLSERTSDQVDLGEVEKIQI